MKKYYEVTVEFNETGAGGADIVLPEALADREWHYVLVHDAEPRAIVSIEAGTAEHKAIAADAACRSMTKKQMTELKKAYPSPKLKQKYLGPEASLAAEAMEEKPVLATFQTVRWRFYLIDVPIGDT